MISDREAASELASAKGLGFACVLLYDPDDRTPRTPGFMKRTSQSVPSGHFVLVMGSVVAPVQVLVAFADASRLDGIAAVAEVMAS